MLKDLLDKGKNFVQTGISELKEKKDIYDKQKLEWDECVKKSTNVVLDKELSVVTEKSSEGRIKKIMLLSPSLNNEKAKIISSIFTLDENILNIKYATCTNNTNYFLIITDRRLMITDLKNYIDLSFTSLGARIVLNGILSQGVVINNYCFTIEGNKETVEYFVNILANPDYRNKVINDYITHIFGIKTKEEYLNSFLRGVSIGEDKRIVIHLDETNNVLVNINDIDSMDVLLDNRLVYTKSLKINTAITGAAGSCYKMDIRFNLKNETTILMNFLPTSVLNKVYNQNDEVFRNNYNQAKIIINRIVSLMTGGF